MVTDVHSCVFCFIEKCLSGVFCTENAVGCCSSLMTLNVEGGGGRLNTIGVCGNYTKFNLRTSRLADFLFAERIVSFCRCRSGIIENLSLSFIKHLPTKLSAVYCRESVGFFVSDWSRRSQPNTGVRCLQKKQWLCTKTDLLAFFMAGLRLNPITFHYRNSIR